jgi:hypothetical protein
MVANIFDYQKAKLAEAYSRDLQPQPLQRDLEAPTAYPVDALGSLLGNAVHAITKSIQCPLALTAQSTLAAATLAVQAFADVEIDGRSFPVSENYLTLGNSGERKTAADRILLHPHRQHEKKFREAYREDLKRFKSEKRAFDESVQRATKAKQKDEKTTSRDEILKSIQSQGDEPIAPIEPFLLVEEPTFEGLMRLLIGGQPSIGLFSDEGGRFIGGHAMNTDNVMRTITGLSKLWDGSPVDRIRAGEGADKLYGRRLSVHLMTQPIIGLRVLSDELMSGQGILARCLTTYPDTTAGTRLYTEVNITEQPDIIRYTAAMLSILETPLPVSDFDPQELQPRKIVFDRVAKQAWIKLHDSIEVAMATKGKLAEIRPFACKAAEHAARLAAVLALVDNVDTGVMAVRHVEAAQALLEHYLNETLRLTSGVSPDAQLIKAQKLGEWLADHHAGLNICLQQIYRESISLARSAKTARGLMKILDSHDWVQRQPDETRANYRGKQVGEVYRIATLDALREVLADV